MNEVRTDFLFADESFLTGMGTVMDLAGSSTEFNTSETSEEADKKAIFSDWSMIGKDISNSIEQFKK